MRLTEGIGPLMYAFDRRNRLLECMRLTVDNSPESQGFVENTPPPALSSSSRAAERPYRRGKGIERPALNPQAPPATQSDPRRHTIMLLPSRQAVTSGLNASGAPQ